MFKLAFSSTRAHQRWVYAILFNLHMKELWLDVPDMREILANPREGEYPAITIPFRRIPENLVIVGGHD